MFGCMEASRLAFAGTYRTVQNSTGLPYFGYTLTSKYVPPTYFGSTIATAVGSTRAARDEFAVLTQAEPKSL